MNRILLYLKLNFCMAKVYVISIIGKHFLDLVLQYNTDAQLFLYVSKETSVACLEHLTQLTKHSSDLWRQKKL